MDIINHPDLMVNFGLVKELALEAFRKVACVFHPFVRSGLFVNGKREQQCGESTTLR